MNRLLGFMLMMGVLISHAGMAAASVDINQASVAQLSALKGVGLKKAQQIIAYRKQHGAFKQLADLTGVKGFGLKTLERLKKQNPGQLVVNRSSNLR